PPQPDALELPSGSTHLRTVHLALNYITAIHFPSLLPMLATVSLRLIETQDLFDLLRSAPALVELRCVVYARPWSDPSKMFMLTHHHLKLLRLAAGSRPDIDQYLCLPALESLEVPKRGAENPDQLLHFLLHCSHSLRRLCHANFNNAWLDILPGLTHLEIPNPDPTTIDLLLHRLNRDENPHILPYLRSFVLTDCVAEKRTLLYLADVLSSRLRVHPETLNDGVNLQSCRVVFRTAEECTKVCGGHLTPDIIEAFGGLVTAGMDIFIGPPGGQQDWWAGEVDRVPRR
ncbi:hypothetical protein C8F01DRAFT_1349988, partial [Mycena amicta]